MLEWGCQSAVLAQGAIWMGYAYQSLPRSEQFNAVFGD